MNIQNSLNDVQKLWMADSRPVEELYDCEADPHNIVNLASDPAYKEVKIELRKMLDGYMLEIGDMGKLSEDQMVEMFWPGGIQPETFVPKLIIDSPVDIEKLAIMEIEAAPAPCEIKMQCPTHGASIAYTLEEGDSPAWKLYSGPVNLPVGEHKMRAKAIRYGYKESAEVVQLFSVVE
jgi:hypothetical protein